jgi:hypothetical protein
MHLSRWLVSSSMLLIAANTWAAADGPPAVGHHAVDFCVSTGGAAPNCGPAQADVREKGAIIVRIDDIAYRLQLHSSQVDIIVMHNATLIDQMTLPYEWSGRELKFNDGDRESRYDIKFMR